MCGMGQRNWGPQDLLMRGIPKCGVIKKLNPGSQLVLEDKMGHQNQRARVRSRKKHGSIEVKHRTDRGGVGSLPRNQSSIHGEL